MRVLTGTSGFSYKEWKGPFYPEDLPNAGMLAYYSSQLSSVEINNTFYRMPKAEMLANWAESVGESFRFSIKASRQITHTKRLKEESLEAVAFLNEQLGSLGGSLGPVLFQMPPFAKVNLERLKVFLGGLPNGMQPAFEFRHESWHSPEVHEALTEHNAALVIADTEETPGQIVATADWAYLRLRRQDYAEESLARWAEQIRAQSWEQVYVFFKHEDEAAGPRMAKQFATFFE
ncbi:MAG: DUF72 domain-containing protein [Myxococcales bacterium]|nr:DUF72 domain-containing protein [Myxococcales bacterium]